MQSAIPVQRSRIAALRWSSGRIVLVGRRLPGRVAARRALIAEIQRGVASERDGLVLRSVQAQVDLSQRKVEKGAVVRLCAIAGSCAADPPPAPPAPRVRAFCDGNQVADHERIWAWHQTISDPEHVAAAKALRRVRVGVLRPVNAEPDVQIRCLADYDAALGLHGGVA